MMGVQCLCVLLVPMGTFLYGKDTVTRGDPDCQWSGCPIHAGYARETKHTERNHMNRCMLTLVQILKCLVFEGKQPLHCVPPVIRFLFKCPIWNLIQTSSTYNLRKAKNCSFAMWSSPLKLLEAPETVLLSLFPSDERTGNLEICDISFDCNICWLHSQIIFAGAFF